MSRGESGEPQDIGVSLVDVLEIQGLAAGGRGVARQGGRVWFVAGGLPGDTAEVQVLRRQARSVSARVLRVLRPSEQRIEPPCPLQPRCGGCPWMALEGPEQLRWKRQLVIDALGRIAGLRDVHVEPIRPSPRVLAYRNRAEFTLGLASDGTPLVGLHANEQTGPGLIDVPRCAILHDEANQVLATAREVLLSGAEAWIHAGRAGEPYRLLVRRSALTGEVLVGLRESGNPFPGLGDLAEALARRHAQVVGVVRLVAHAGRRGGMRSVPVWGRGWITERIGGATFKLSAASFLQVNLDVAEVVLDVVLESAGDVAGRDVLELYGGVGVYGLALAARGARVEICEADGEAVACGREAAGSAPVPFTRSDVRAFIERLQAAGSRPDCVVANPPRTGFGPGVAAGIAGLGPRRVVIVSCDPATLARDVRALTERGFGVERVVPVDMFPQTAHVETVLSLVRRDP